MMGFRVIKTALATLIAISTALLIGNPNPLSAGLLAILGVETTRWKGLQTVFARFMASVAGLAMAGVLFAAVGFHVWALSLYILVAFPLLARAGLKDGIVTGSVVVFHLYAGGEVSFRAFATELELLVIGLGWATVFNMAYMPQESRTLLALRQQLEDGFSAVFRELAGHLRDPDKLWAGEELLAAEAAIERGIAAATRSRENRLFLQDEPWLLYFHMRRQQSDAIEGMMESVAFVSRKLPQADMLADLFDRLAVDVKSEYYEGETERRLGVLEAEFRAMTLPATREEFEMRAALFQLTRDLRAYVTIARRQKKQKATSAHTIIQ